MIYLFSFNLSYRFCRKQLTLKPWQMVIPFVDAKTRGKITMAYKGRDLTQYFEEDKLPSSLGGVGEEEDLFIPILRLKKEDVVLGKLPMSSKRQYSSRASSVKSINYYV